jgi:hypothetical protein
VSICWNREHRCQCRRQSQENCFFFSTAYSDRTTEEFPRSLFVSLLERIQLLAGLSLSESHLVYDDELIYSEDGLGFEMDAASSSVHVLGALVTISKAEAADAGTCPPRVIYQPLIASNHKYFDIMRLKEQQSTDPATKRAIHVLRINPNLSFELYNNIL